MAKKLQSLSLDTDLFSDSLIEYLVHSGSYCNASSLEVRCTRVDDDWGGLAVASVG